MATLVTATRSVQVKGKIRLPLLLVVALIATRLPSLQAQGGISVETKARIGDDDDVFLRHPKLVVPTPTPASRRLDNAPTPPKDAIMITLTSLYDNVTDVGPIISKLVQGMEGTTVKFVYNNAIKGASIANITKANMIMLLNKRAVQLGSMISSVSISDYVQTSPPWGLDRIDQQMGAPLDGSYSYNGTGRGVTVYVVDTGIRPSHTDFQGRASCEYSSVDGMECYDVQSHGTHVAGTIGGAKYGVAKRVKLVGVNVLDADGFGTTDDIVAGIDWVTGLRKAGNRRPMIINQSLQGSKNELWNMACNGASRAGIVVVVAAANFGDDACLYSPASSEQVITVGATAIGDVAASFSNLGRCVEIFAPGVDVESAYIECDTCSIKYSGTSMASPHVAGVVALYLEKNPKWKPHQVLSALRKAAVPNKIKKMKIPSPNLLLNMQEL